LAGVLAVLLAGAIAPADAQNTARGAKIAAARTTYTDYQVAAGTFLSIELRTPLSSATARVGDPVDGRLLRPIVGEEDVELVPAGAAVLGTVREVEAAAKKTPGRLALAFHVIEHPDTGSRASIRTTLLTFESERAPKAKAFPEIHLARGSDASVTLLAPLSVKIPVARRP
jgi:hypothetical protein